MRAAGEADGMRPSGNMRANALSLFGYRRYFVSDSARLEEHRAPITLPDTLLAVYSCPVSNVTNDSGHHITTAQRIVTSVTLPFAPMDRRPCGLQLFLIKTHEYQETE